MWGKAEKCAERFAYTRELFKTTGNCSRLRKIISKHLGAFRGNARTSQNGWEHFALKF